MEWEKTEKLASKKILQNPLNVEELGNWYSYFSRSMDAFSPLDACHPIKYFITWELHGLSHQFPKALEKSAKPIKWGRPGKLIPILFP